MSEDFVRGRQPPAASHAVVQARVIYAMPGAPLTVVMLGERSWGVTTHWRPAGPWGTARSLACIAPELHCPHCHLPTQWVGYYGVWDCAASKPAILAVTADAQKQFAWRRSAGASSPKPPLRGSKWIVRRTTARKNSPLALELLQLRTTGYELQPEPDARHALRRMYPELIPLLSLDSQEDEP